MRERRQNEGWVGVLAGMTGMALLVLAILIALGARIAGEPRQPNLGAVAQVAPTAAPQTEIIVAGATPVTTSEAAEHPQTLADWLRDGETVWVEFASGLSLAGVVQVENGVPAILNPLGRVIDLGEVAALVKADGQRLIPADFGIEAKVLSPAPAVAAQVKSAPDHALQVQAGGLDNDLAVSELLDQYPDGTLFRATLRNGEEVVAMKENRLKLVRVDAASGRAGKTIVPPWMIVSLTPVSIDVS